MLVRVMCMSVLQEACQRKGITARTVHGVLMSHPLSHRLCCPAVHLDPRPIVPILSEILLGTVLLKREMEEAREFVPRPPVLFIRDQKILNPNYAFSFLFFTRIC